MRTLVGLGVVIAGVAYWKGVLGRAFDPLPILPAAFIALSRAWQWRRPLASAHAALPTVTEGSDAFPVTLEIYDAEGRLSGMETGWVAFPDGWLVYEGLRTSFSLNEDVVIHAQYEESGVRLRLRDGRRVELSILSDPQWTHLPAPRRDVVRMNTEVRDWLRAPRATGAPVLPPQEDHPQTVLARLAFPPTYCFGALFVGSLLFWFGGLGLAAPFLIAAAGCALWFVVGVYRFWRVLPGLIR